MTCLIDRYWPTRKKGYYWWTTKKLFYSLHLVQKIYIEQHVDALSVMELYEDLRDVMQEVFARLKDEPSMKTDKEKFFKDWASFCTRQNRPRRKFAKRLLSLPQYTSSMCLDFMYRYRWSIEEFFVYLGLDSTHHVAILLFDACSSFTTIYNDIDEWNWTCSKIYTIPIYRPLSSLSCLPLVARHWSDLFCFLKHDKLIHHDHMVRMQHI